jgi:predicted MarR family transcription regulator
LINVNILKKSKDIFGYVYFIPYVCGVISSITHFKLSIMSTINLTDLEKLVLEGINNSDYGDDLGDPIWSWSINCTVKGKARSGVVSSLSQKGLVGSNGSGKDDTVWLTPIGVEICKEHGLQGKYK